MKVNGNDLEKKFNKVVGEHLRKMRESKNYSLQDLSDKIGNTVTRQTLFNYEMGITKIKDDTFIEICNVCNINPKEAIKHVYKEYGLFLTNYIDELLKED